MAEPVLNTYDGLIAALRDRRVGLDLSAEEVDRAARLPLGSCVLLEGEILAPEASRKRSIDWAKLFRIAKVLGVDFTLVRSRTVSKPKTRNNLK